MDRLSKKFTTYIGLILILISLLFLNLLRGQDLLQSSNNTKQIKNSKTSSLGENDTKKSIDLILIIDQSKSMNGIDTSNQRIRAVKFSAKFLKKYSDEVKNHRVGVVLLGTNAELALPLTLTKEFKPENLKIQRAKDNQYTYFQLALECAYEEFKRQDSFNENRNPQILLVSDGIFKDSIKWNKKKWRGKINFEQEENLLINKIGNELLKLSDSGCTINTVLLLSNNAASNPLWKDYAKNSEGMYYEIDVNENDMNFEKIMSKILSKMLSLYCIKMINPKVNLNVGESFFFKARIFKEGVIIKDSSIVLETHIKSPNSRIDTSFLHSNMEGEFLGNYNNVSQKGIYKVDLKALEQGNILAKLKTKMEVLNIDTKSSNIFEAPRKSMFWNIVTIFLIFSFLILLIASILYLIFKRKSSLRIHPRMFLSTSITLLMKKLSLKRKMDFGDYIEELNKDPKDTNKTLALSKNIRKELLEIERKGGFAFCLIFRNLHIAEDNEISIEKFMKNDDCSSAMRAGIGYGVAFTLFMSLYKPEENLFLMVYKYIDTIARCNTNKELSMEDVQLVPMEIFRCAVEFFEKNYFEEIAAFSRDIFKDINIIPGNTLYKKNKDITRAICEIYYYLFSITEFNFTDKLRSVIIIMRELDCFEKYKDFLLGIYETIHNSSEPKFWEGYLPFMISRHLHHNTIPDGLPNSLLNVKVNLEEVNKNGSVYPIEDMIYALKKLENSCSNLFLPEHKLSKLLSERWKKEIEKAFYITESGQKKFNNLLKPDIRINLITRRIPINSPEYEAENSKRKPIYFDLINRSNSNAKNIEIVIVGENSIPLYIPELKSHSSERCEYDVKYIFETRVPQKIDFKFELTFSDLQKKDNFMHTDNYSLEFYLTGDEIVNTDIRDVFNRALSEKFLNEFIKEIRHNNVFVNIIGQPGIGKTSLMRAVRERVSYDIFVFIDIESTEHPDLIESFIKEKTNDHFIKEIGQCLFLKNSKKKFGINESIISLIKRKRILIILDDFFSVKNFSCFLGILTDIIEAFQKLKKAGVHLTLISSGTRFLDELIIYSTPENILDGYSMQSQLIKEFRMEPIKKDTFEALLLECDVVKRFNELAVMKVHEVAGGNPFFINLLLDVVEDFRRTENIKYVTLSHMSQILGQRILSAMETKQNALFKFWEKFTKEEMVILLALTKSFDEKLNASFSDVAIFWKKNAESLALSSFEYKKLQKIITFMSRKKIILEEYGRIKINSILLKRWINENRKQLHELVKER